MTISEMHVLFRAVGQQMGLQRVRAILPETIDTFINDAINEKVRSLIMSNTAQQFPDKITVQHNPVSPFNALRTLYKEGSIAVPSSIEDYYSIPAPSSNIMVYTSFSIHTINNKTYKCRLLEHDDLQNVIHDYCSAPSLEYPVVSAVGGNFRLYPNDTSISEFRYAYIQNPATVSISASIDCDLPDYLHTEIVEIAVQKFFKSVGSTTQQVQ